MNGLLRTSEYRGDHTADVSVAFDVNPNETVRAMLARVPLIATSDWLEIRLTKREVEAVLQAAQGTATDPWAVTSGGQANTCTHLSATGVDTAEDGPDKVWRCDHCGLTWKQGDRE